MNDSFAKEIRNNLNDFDTHDHINVVALTRKKIKTDYPLHCKSMFLLAFQYFSRRLPGLDNRF